MDKKVEKAFLDSLEMGQDQAKLNMLEAGCPFKSVTRLYNQLSIRYGLINTPEERAKIVNDVCRNKNLKAKRSFDRAITTIQSRGSGINEKSAASLIRAWCRRNNQDYYVAPPRKKTRNPFKQKFYQALLDNPMMTEKELKALIRSLPVRYRKNPTKELPRWNEMRSLVNQIVERPNDD